MDRVDDLDVGSERAFLMTSVRNRCQLKLGVDYQYIHYWDGSDQLANRMYGYIPSAYINYSGRIKNLMYGLGSPCSIMK
jgi:hypothetical protein